MRPARWISGLLLTAGILLIAGGGYVWLDSWLGQEGARNTWTATGSLPLESESAAPPPPQWESGILARLSFPRLNEERFVLEGATKRNLSRGPARLSVTGIPGKSGNCVIAGHRDTHFRMLKDIREGDTVLLDYGLQTYRYRVKSLHVVRPSNSALLRPETEPVLTLVTCYPFYWVGPAPKRFIVRAELDGVEPAHRRSSL